MESRRVITLLTDFGERDAYVSAMKGVILGICPEATIVDISHGVSRHSVRQGAFLLSQAAPYFPEGTIHVVVVDPGVGTTRRRIVVQGRRSFYVGPDNGVLLPAAEAEGVVKAVEVRERRFLLPSASTTFDGRDVFAPVAAHLARGVKIEEFGPEAHGFVRLPLAEARVERKKILGEVVHIDSFGNIVTNVPRRLLEDLGVTEGSSLEVKIGERSRTMRFCRAYGEVAMNELLAVIGSSGFLEISVNQGSAQKRLKAEVEQRIEVSIISA